MRDPDSTDPEDGLLANLPAGDDIDFDPHDDPEADDLETPEPEPPDDFADLDAIVAAGEAQLAARRDLKQKERRLRSIAGSTAERHQAERAALLESIRRLEEGIVWTTTRAIALFHEQHCLSCGHTHRWFDGWMTEQVHKTDLHARRLLRGRPVEELPQAIEILPAESCELCSDCVETCIMVESVVRAA